MANSRANMWTQFSDMHSGGGKKLAWGKIYIEAARREAEVIFYNRFGRNPYRITCTCCGEDYSVYEYKTLEDATNYEINHSIPSNGRPKNIEEFLSREDILVVRAEEIQPEEKIGELPMEGYYWYD